MVRIGIDYYPEHWDTSMWDDDIARMKALGTHVVRVAEFAWSRMEPTDGNFDFDWLDSAVKKISDAGMQIIMGTPTNCAPLWFYEAHPEAMQVEGSNSLRRRGIRGHRCFNNPDFRFYAKRIIEEQCKRYAGKPEIFAWQIDNELDNSHCTCPTCRAKFREFIQEKYGTLEALNKAYGNVVWSAEYSSWSQVEPPMFDGLPGDYYNTALVLDFERFGSLTTRRFVDFQVDIIRSFDPNAVITTNACFPQHMPNFHQEFENLDVASYDNYPPVRLPDDPEATYSNAFALDFVRGFKNKNFWIMEEQAAHMGCWAPMSPIPVPGQIMGYGLQAVAHGADLLCFFRWRTAHVSSEMFCSGLLDHNSKENRRYREVQTLGKRLTAYPDMSETTPISQVAILYGADQEFTLKNQWQSDGYWYWTQMKLIHDACMNMGVNVDVIEETCNLDKYKVVIVPSHIIINPQVVANVKAFAKAGGTVLITNRSGVKDQNGNCIVGEYLPTVFADLVGCYVEEYDPIGKITQKVADTSGEEYNITSWADLLVLQSAKPWATYADHYYKGTAAISKNEFGDGKAYYLGTVGCKALYRKLLAEVFDEAAIGYTTELPLGVELSSRGNENKEVRFLVNNTGVDQSFSFEGKDITMAPFEVVID